MKNRAAQTSLSMALCGVIGFACGGPIDRTSATKPKVANQQHHRVKFVFDTNPELANIPSSPNVVLVEKPTEGGSIPDFGEGNLLLSSSGNFTFSAATHPGSGVITLAPVVDPNGSGPPPNFGSGSWTNIQVAGANYSTTVASSMSGVFPDPSGTDFLVVSAFTEEPQPNGTVIGTVLHVLVPSADFAVGASVNLDGVDRVALFARGDISLPDPMIAAAAVTGTVTFTAGGLSLGNQISLTVGGDFGEIQWNSMPPPPPPPPGTPIATGTFTLAFLSQVDAQCDGTLAGNTSAFAALSATQAGFVGGVTQIAAAASPGHYTIAGSAIQSSLGATPFALAPLPDAPPSVVGGYGTVVGTGPLNTQIVDTFFALDGDQSTPTAIIGFAGRAYMNAAQDGWCSAIYLVELTP